MENHKATEDHETTYQMIFPQAMAIKGIKIVEWAMQVAEDEGRKMPGSVKEAIQLLDSLGIATFAS